MSKKILICGKNYDISANNCVAVAKSIQKHIDKICNDPDNPNERLVDISLELLEKANGEELDITFTFERNNLFAKNGVNPDFINDSDGMLIMGMDGYYSPPAIWECVQPIGSTNRYHIPLEEFVYAYAESVKESGATELKGIRIESSKTKLVGDKDLIQKRNKLTFHLIVDVSVPCECFRPLLVTAHCTYEVGVFGSPVHISNKGSASQVRRRYLIERLGLLSPVSGLRTITTRLILAALNTLLIATLYFCSEIKGSSPDPL